MMDLARRAALSPAPAPRRWRRFRRDDRGAVGMAMAIAVPTLISVAALAVDGGILYYRHVVLRSISDLSALSGAIALPKGRDVATLEAHAVSSANGYPHGERGASIVVNIPPSRGAFTTDPSAVEVVVTAPQRPYLSRIVHPSDYVLQTRTVATYAIQPGCILALNPTAANAVVVSGSAELKATNCDIYANSPASGAVATHGAGAIDVRAIATPGTVSGRKITAQTITTGPQVSTVENPYDGLPIPAMGACMPAPPRLRTFTLSPGRYCGGLDLTGPVNVTFAPGVYVIDGGSLRFGGGQIRGEGVAFILTSYSASPPATVTIGGSSDVYLTAPTTGVYAGIAFYADPRSPASATQSFGGGGDQYIGGAVVAPTSTIHYGGARGPLSGAGCTQLVGWTVEFKGNSALAADCTSLGGKAFGVKSVRIVE